MATIAGSVSTREAYYDYYITWSEGSVDNANNTSVVSASVYIVKTSTAANAEGSQNSNTLYIDGTSFTANNYVDLNPEMGPVLLVSGSKTITHGSDGSKSITISASGSLPTGGGWGPTSGSASGTAVLTTITRATTVTTTAASSIGEVSATVGGNVTDAGIPACSERGIYWGTTADSQTNKVTSGSGSGTFNVNITGLAGGTKYYFKAYGYNTSGYSYGSVLDFTTTSNIPEVTTTTATNIAFNSADSGGEVISEHGSTVTERGVCYSTSANPTTSDSKVSNGTGTGVFTAALVSLAPVTKYYYRAYATNGIGTAYGSESSFTTLSAAPTVTTSSSVLNIMSYGATVQGEVVADNGAAITERGFVYGTSVNPTTANSKAIVTGTVGTMTKTIGGLATITTYHFRAYAINSYGITYGSDYTFLTKPTETSSLVCTVIDKTQMNLTWVKGSGNYTIVRRGTTPPSNINSGTLVYSGTGTSCSDTGLTAGTTYYYRTWSSTTADWSVVYSVGYSSGNGTTISNFTNPGNPLTDDSDYATIPTNDGVLSAQISKDGGATWSLSKSITFTASVETKSFGLGTAETWGMSMIGTDMDDANFAIKLTGGTNGLSYQTYSGFGFALTDTYILTGVNVQVKAAYDGANLLLYFVKADPQYGTSNLPIGEGSIAYDTTLKKPTYYDGLQWLPIGAGGGGISFKGPWATTTDYLENDIVQGGKDLYIAKIDHTSGSVSEPGVGTSWTDDWTLFLAGNAGLSVQCDSSETTGSTKGALSGLINGSNALFTVSLGSYISGSLRISKNGQLLTEGSSADYIETTPGSGTFTLTTAPATGTRLEVMYQFSTGSTGNADTLDNLHSSAFALKNEWNNGWIPITGTCIYVSVNSFKISGDWTAIYQIGDKFRLTQTTPKYFRVTGISYSNPDTTIIVEAFNLYALANAPITESCYSRMETPLGFPLREKVLFNGTAATSVTLSENSAYFDRLLVYYVQQGAVFSTFVNMATSAAEAVMVVQGNFDAAYRIRTGTAALTVSGTTLSFGGSGSNYSTDTTSGSVVSFSDIKILPAILKVIGFRW